MSKLPNLPQNCTLIHTDGACSGNPGPGGWAAIIDIITDGEAMMRLPLSGGENDTTNIRMEMTAAVVALQHVAESEGHPIVVRTDSQLVVKGMTEWLPRWIANGWKGSDKKPVKNQDLWRQLATLTEGRKVTFVWVRGHDGDEGNEEVDRMAAKEAQRRKAALLAG